MGQLARISLEVSELRQTFGLGVAGNFAGHLEQAGEAADFVNVATQAAEMPKGIFPWYSPGATTFLGKYPLSGDILAIPGSSEDELRIQIEPEVALMCNVVRDTSGEIVGLTPCWVAAFDDCSIRRPNAAKISEKKNWGSASKGLAPMAITVSDINPLGAVAPLRLASFLRRAGETHAYGVDSAIPSYTLIGDELLEWLVDRLRNQEGAANTPLEDVGAMLLACAPDRPSGEQERVIVGVGATRYEQYGESTFVEIEDEAIVVLYDADVHSPQNVWALIAEGRDSELHAASVLRRRATTLN